MGRPRVRLGMAARQTLATAMLPLVTAYHFRIFFAIHRLSLFTLLAC